MNQEVIRQLNQINKDFYSKIADEFDRSRSYYWEGWERLYETLPMVGFQLGKVIRVLDVGCGNGRFASFLIDKGEILDYEGWDQSKKLLNAAQKRFEPYKGESEIKFESFDLVEDDLKDHLKGRQFDLIVMFGVMHHIPSYQLRKDLLKKFSDALSTDGLVVFTTWDFLGDDKYKHRVIPWDEVGVSNEDLEDGDKLLDWRRGEKALRYCHSFRSIEFEKLLSETDIRKFEQFDADGKSGKMNRYYLIR